MRLLVPVFLLLTDTASGGGLHGDGDDSAATLRLPPEPRYTRWTANITQEGDSLRFAPDQVEMLLGITF
jgi:hypothetical protein